jgi:hypothetical protein
MLCCHCDSVGFCGATEESLHDLSLERCSNLQVPALEMTNARPSVWGHSCRLGFFTSGVILNEVKDLSVGYGLHKLNCVTCDLGVRSLAPLGMTS